MKNRIFRTCAVPVLILCLCLSMTGCSKQTYRKAVELYNAGRYDAAATLFSQISDYEDSGELQTLSRYWEAVTYMEEGDYGKALPRFLKLGDYKDSAARANECRYQKAIAAFDSDDFATAESLFLENPNYRMTQEYLRQITWQRFYDAVSIAQNGGSLEKSQDGTVLRITAADTNTLILCVSNTKDADFRFYDDLTVTVSRDTLEADFTATSSFDMDFLDSQIGSAQTATGKVDLSSDDPRLIIQDFQMIITDNHGRTATVNDPAQCLMNDSMAENLSVLLTEIPPLLTEAGMEWTLADIGIASNT